MLRGLRQTQAIAVLALACASFADAAVVVDFATARWTSASGGDGALRALVVVEGAWSWHEANALADALGAQLARAESPQELSFLTLLSDHPGAFDCAGPWLGSLRAPQSPWIWSSGAAVGAFGWPPLRPAQSVVLESALLMSGIDGPDGKWIDVLPEPDSGVGTRSCLLVWSSFPDCDGDEIPDALEIARTPSLDANRDGILDACVPPNPADVNGDGRVDAQDIAIVLNAWGTADGAADIDGSGMVDAADLAAVLSGWNAG
ncbi:MAG: Dockerin type domain [Planctomycetota bacterium]|jgi:hypothetical protein